MDLSEAQLRSSIAIDSSRNTRQATTLLVYRSAQMRAQAANTRQQSLGVVAITKQRISESLPSKTESAPEALVPEPKVAA